MPPVTKYVFNFSSSGPMNACGMFSGVSMVSRYSTRFLSPLASKNSVNVMGCISKNSTLPTGNPDASFNPKREPAPTTLYCGASSQKYFSEFKALSQVWISSKMISVFSVIFFPLAIARFARMRFTSLVCSKNCLYSICLSKSMWRKPSGKDLPNSFNTQVLPT